MALRSTLAGEGGSGGSTVAGTLAQVLAAPTRIAIEQRMPVSRHPLPGSPPRD